MKKQIRCSSLKSIIFSAIILLCSMGLWAQDAELGNYEADSMISAAKEIMETTRYCALITLDKSGHPQARTMDPFPPEEDMVVYFGTNTNSRKLREIRNDSRVTLYYGDPNGTGYVVIQGKAILIDDPEILVKYWKEEWEKFYPDKNSTYALIRVNPEKLEIIDYKHGIVGASETWTVPHVDF